MLELGFMAKSDSTFVPRTLVHAVICGHTDKIKPSSEAMHYHFVVLRDSNVLQLGPEPMKQSHRGAMAPGLSRAFRH